MSSLSFHPPAFVFFRVCALREWFSLNQELIVVAISNVCSPLFSFLREYVFCRVCMCMRVCTSSCVTFPRVSFLCLSFVCVGFPCFCLACSPCWTSWGARAGSVFRARFLARLRLGKPAPHWATIAPSSRQRSILLGKTVREPSSWTLPAGRRRSVLPRYPPPEGYFFVLTTLSKKVCSQRCFYRGFVFCNFIFDHPDPNLVVDKSSCRNFTLTLS